MNITDSPSAMKLQEAPARMRPGFFFVVRAPTGGCATLQKRRACRSTS